MSKTSEAKIDLSSWLLPLACLLFLQGCGGGVYHKPAFSGRVLELDTKRPIEGAVVVVSYSKEHPGVGAGPVSYPVAVRETLTDQEGRFRIPSFTTLMEPPFYEAEASFTIYKPGYMAFSGRGLERCLSGNCRALTQRAPYSFNDEVVFSYRPGEVELRPMRDRKERLIAYEYAESGTDFDPTSTPLLIKVLSQERAYLGFTPY